MSAVNLLQGLCHHGQGDQGEAADGETVGDLLEEEDLGDHGDDDGGGPESCVTCHVTLCHVTADLSTSATAPAFSSLRARMPRLTWLRHITPAEGMIITTGN